MKYATARWVQDSSFPSWLVFRSKYEPLLTGQPAAWTDFDDFRVRCTSPPRLALYSLTERARTPFHAEPTQFGRGGGDRTIKSVANTQVIDPTFRQTLQKRSSEVQKKYKRLAWLKRTCVHLTKSFRSEICIVLQVCSVKRRASLTSVCPLRSLQMDRWASTSFEAVERFEDYVRAPLLGAIHEIQVNQPREFPEFVDGKNVREVAIASFSDGIPGAPEIQPHSLGHTSLWR